MENIAVITQNIPVGQASAAEIQQETAPPRAAHRVYRRSCRIPAVSAFAAAIGTGLGAYAACSVSGADFSGSILCVSGSFWELLGMRLLWGMIFLTAEYILGFFALGDLLVWTVPLVCGLGTGAALTGAFSQRGFSAAVLLPSCIASVSAVVMGAGISQAMSSQLLRLVSTNKNSIVAARPAAGEYTLRFLVCLTILLGAFIAEAAFRAFSV